MKIIDLILVFFQFLISLNNCIIVIPFKTYVNKEPDNFSASDVIYYWGKNIIYSNSLIGTPPKQISMIIQSENFESDLYQNMCDISGSFYKNNESTSFYIEKEIIAYKNKNNVSGINETVYFYDSLNLKKLKPFNYFHLLYSNNKKSAQEDIYDYHENTCINIGFLKKHSHIYEDDYNLIYQLKNKFKIIETYDFTFKYNNEFEGQIVIGVEPHIYDPENYFISQFRYITDNSMSYDLNYYFLNFDKKYFSYKNKTTGELKKENLNPNTLLGIKFDLGVVFGTLEYEQKIKKCFFDVLINEGKCFVETVNDKKKDNDKYNVYYCNKDSTEKIIKNEFPTLYFEMKQFDKIFELTYKDLFREKDGKIYFLVYFKQNNYFSYDFLIGSIFLKKYSFTFNQNIPSIGYYNENLPGGKKEKNNNLISFMNNKVLIIIIIFLVIIFGFLGFFLGKIVYDQVRKKRINEVDDNYDYISQENNNNKASGLGLNETE